MFTRLQELLREADDITSGVVAVSKTIKSGWDNTEKAFKGALAKLSANDKKQLKADVDYFIAQYFDKFPNYDGEVGGPEDILKKYPRREMVVVAFNAFNRIATRLGGLRKGFIKSIVDSKLLTPEEARRLISDSSRYTSKSEPPAFMTSFVRDEAAFFKRLIQIDNDFKLDDDNFKELLAQKYKLTDTTDGKYKAALNIDILLSFMVNDFLAYAKTLSIAGSKMPQSVKEDAGDAADRAAERLKKATAARKETEKETERKQKEAEKAAEKAVDSERKIKDKASKEAEAAIKAAAADHKANTADSIQELRKDLDTYANTMIDAFPFDKVMTTDDVMEKFPTREAALAAFKAYRDVGDRLEQLLGGFTRSIASTGKVRDEQLKRYKVQADRMLKGGNPAVPGQLVRFVKAESKFFKRLIQIGDDLKLDAEEFKDRLTIKINQTDAARIPDAAQALTLLFAYLSARYRENARVIADVGRSMDDENVTVKKTARDAAAASAAAEIETRAKVSGR